MNLENGYSSMEKEVETQGNGLAKALLSLSTHKCSVHMILYSSQFWRGKICQMFLRKTVNFLANRALPLPTILTVHSHSAWLIRGAASRNDTVMSVPPWPVGLWISLFHHAHWGNSKPEMSICSVNGSEIMGLYCLTPSICWSAAVNQETCPPLTL